MTATLPPALIPTFRRLLQAVEREPALRRWETAFTVAVKQSDADALECVHRYLNALYCARKAAAVQGLVNDVEAEIERYWEGMREAGRGLGAAAEVGG